MQFDAEQKEVAAAGSNRTAEEHLSNARVTQVFARHPDGNLRIVHEHISLPDES
ncbi:MAG: hypothetical protein LAP21_06820 [Acidobacteriia bacterium]|nr:hypothetical protein [Terriglobia bacterium]